MNSIAAARLDLEVDGGIKVDNSADVAEAGANVFVSGSGIFGQAITAELIRGCAMRHASERSWSYARLAAGGSDAIRSLHAIPAGRTDVSIGV